VKQKRENTKQRDKDRGRRGHSLVARGEKVKKRKNEESLKGEEIYTYTHFFEKERIG
jgi:hypothetical protein